MAGDYPETASRYFPGLWRHYDNVRLFIPDNSDKHYNKCYKQKYMNKRAEIINKKPYDPDKSQCQSDNIVFIGHCNFELADCLKSKGITGYGQ